MLGDKICCYFQFEFIRLSDDRMYLKIRPGVFDNKVMLINSIQVIFYSHYSLKTLYDTSKSKYKKQVNINQFYKDCIQFKKDFVFPLLPPYKN